MCIRDDRTDAIPGGLKELEYCAHKLNNMLTVIQGNAELIRLKTGNTVETTEILTCCQESMSVLKHLISVFKTK